MKSTVPQEQSLHSGWFTNMEKVELRPFVMISRCNEVRVHNSCRELLVLLSAQKYMNKVFNIYIKLSIERPYLLRANIYSNK